MRKIIISISLLATVFLNKSVAQTVITDDSTYTQSSTNALFEVYSSQGNKGILIPRLTTAQRTAIATVSNDEGLLVYDTDTHSFWVWDGTNWVEISDKQTLSLSGTDLSISNGNNVDLSSAINSTAWSLSGNPISSGQFLGTTNNEDLVFKTNNTSRIYIKNNGYVGINTSNPSSIFQVNMSGTNNLFRIDNDNNIGMELRSETTGGTPFIDFANDGSSDYDARIILSGDDELNITGADLGIYGALKPNGDAGTSGQILTSQGPGQPPVWETPASIPLYGNNASSVELNTLVYTTNTSSYEDIPGMTITFTPEHDYFYIFASLVARLADDNGYAQYGMAMVYVRVLVNGIEVAKSASIITDYDDQNGVITSGSVAFSGIRAHVTSGQSTTVKLQWKAVVLVAADPWRIEINPNNSDVADHCVLTVFD